MTEAGGVFLHARAAGYQTVADYALELESVLEAIVEANRSRPYEPEDMQSALGYAGEIVDGWDIRP